MVSGDTLFDFVFFNPETQQNVIVNLPIKDGIQLKLLQKISEELARIDR